MLAFLWWRADAERRAALSILATMRWALIGAAFFQVNYRPGSDAPNLALLNALLIGAVVLNAGLQVLLARGRRIVLAYPILVGFYDAVSVTGAIAAVDRFDNPSFLLYYPALIAFVLVFPGKWSAVYTVAIMGAYTGAAMVPDESFDPASTADQKAITIRLLTMATAAMMANLVVRVERRRRLQAVEAERRRSEEAMAAEQRARAAEARIEEERQRLSRDVHDGVSQSVYMLMLGLDTASEAARRDANAALAERLDALHALSRETLLDTRNLLFALGGVMAGEASLSELVRNQAREFSAVSGIPVNVQISGEELRLAPAAVSQMFRITQEALSNAMRHSGAGHVAVSVTYGDGDVSLAIRDDGRGFEPSEAVAGHGLANMRHRAESLGGAANVTAAPGQGAIVSVTIPASGGESE
jgi:signal transduction histidine kinase